MDFRIQQAFSDLEIISSDGVKLYFNRFMMYNASDYFKNLLTDPKIKTLNLNKSSNCLSTVFNIMMDNSPNVNYYIFGEVVIALDEYNLVKLMDRITIIINGANPSDILNMFNILIKNNKSNIVAKLINKNNLTWNTLFLDFNKLDHNILTTISPMNLIENLYNAHKDDHEIKGEIALNIPAKRYYDISNKRYISILWELLKCARPCKETLIRYNKLIENIYQMIPDKTNDFIESQQNLNNSSNNINNINNSNNKNNQSSNQNISVQQPTPGSIRSSFPPGGSINPPPSAH